MNNDDDYFELGQISKTCYPDYHDSLKLTKQSSREK